MIGFRWLRDRHARAWRLYLWRCWLWARFRTCRCTYCGSYEFILGRSVGNHRDCPPF